MTGMCSGNERHRARCNVPVTTALILVENWFEELRARLEAR